jgi:N-acetylneuraminic acid mutarotase
VTDTFTQVTWSTRADGPIGRAEALRAVVDGKLYVFAGFSGDDGPVVRSDVYDPAANSWTQIADMPRRLTHAGVAVVGHDVYFAGGYIGIGRAYTQQFGTKEVWRYNVDDDSYTRMPDLPADRAGGGLVAVGRELHYFGGNNAARQDVADHYVLSLDDTGAGWSARAAMSGGGRSHMGYVELGGKIYAIGGQIGNDEALTTKSLVQVYDAATDTWTNKASMPKGISHISSATFVMGGRIVVIGGETAHNASIGDAYAYDPGTDKWTKLTSLPAPRFSGVAAAIDGVIYFTSGSSQRTTYRGTPVT